MALILVLVAIAAATLAWKSATLRAAIQNRPGQAVFYALLVTALVLVSFRTGRQWLAILALTALFWGRKLLPWILRARAAGSAPGSIPHGAPAPRPERMSRLEALEILGLDEQATRDQIVARYRTLMKQIHPDRGGSSYLAKRVNEAKRVLIDS